MGLEGNLRHLHLRCYHYHSYKVLKFVFVENPKLSKQILDVGPVLLETRSNVPT